LCCVVHVWLTWVVWWQFPSFHVISILALCSSTLMVSFSLFVVSLSGCLVCLFVYVYVSSYMLVCNWCVCLSVYVHMCVHVRLYVGMCVYVYMYVLSFRIVLFQVWRSCEVLWLGILGRLILPYGSWLFHPVEFLSLFLRVTLLWLALYLRQGYIYIYILHRLYYFCLYAWYSGFFAWTFLCGCSSCYVYYWRHPFGIVILNDS